MTGFGVDPEKLHEGLELPSNEAVRAAVEAGAGATVISSLVARAGLASGSLAELPFAFPERRFLALRHGDRHHARAAMALLEVIRQAAV